MREAETFVNFDPKLIDDCLVAGDSKEADFFQPVALQMAHCRINKMHNRNWYTTRYPRGSKHRT